MRIAFKVVADAEARYWIVSDVALCDPAERYPQLVDCSKQCRHATPLMAAATTFFTDLQHSSPITT